MIKLEIKSYCEECTEFEPELEKREKQVIPDDPYEMPYIMYDNIVKCRHKKKCINLHGFLKDEVDKDTIIKESIDQCVSCLHNLIPKITSKCEACNCLWVKKVILAIKN